MEVPGPRIPEGRRPARPEGEMARGAPGIPNEAPAWAPGKMSSQTPGNLQMLSQTLLQDFCRAAEGWRQGIQICHLPDGKQSDI